MHSVRVTYPESCKGWPVNQTSVLAIWKAVSCRISVTYLHLVTPAGHQPFHGQSLYMLTWDN